MNIANPEKLVKKSSLVWVPIPGISILNPYARDQLRESFDFRTWREVRVSPVSEKILKVIYRMPKILLQDGSKILHETQ